MKYAYHQQRASKVTCRANCLLNIYLYVQAYITFAVKRLPFSLLGFFGLIDVYIINQGRNRDTTCALIMSGRNNHYSSVKIIGLAAGQLGRTRVRQ